MSIQRDALSGNSGGREIATLFVSTTNRCNLSCRYCSAGAGPEIASGMDPGVAEAAVRDWIISSSLKQITLILTGGEPLLWGYENLGRVCRAARGLSLRHGAVLTIGIQSNGSLVDGRFARFCREFAIEPCFSMDGPPHVSDLCRGSGDRVFAALKGLQREGIDFGIVCCLTDGVADNIEEVLEWFRKEKFHKIRINSLGAPPPGRNAKALSCETRFEVKRATYEHMSRHGKDSLRERNVMRQVLAFEKWWQGRAVPREHCERIRCGAGVHLACLNPDGSYGLCVEKSMTDGLATAKSLDGLKEKADGFWAGLDVWERCRDCVAGAICDHGCVAYHKMQFSRFESECEANREFLKYLIRVHDKGSRGKLFAEGIVQ